MQSYQKKDSTVSAVQWFKNGDHPADDCTPIGTGKTAMQGEGHVVRYFRHPVLGNDAYCALCKQRFHVHGWIDPSTHRTLSPDGQTVCPGDYVCTDAEGKHFALKPDVFAATYEPA